MPEDPTGSEDDRPQGGTTEGAGEVDTPTTGTPVAPDPAEAARRKWQSDLDRERAARAAAEAELAKLKGQTPTPPQTFDGPAVAAIVRESMRRERETAEVKAQAAKDYPNADPALLADADKFDSPEALRLALKESDEKRGNWLAAERERIAAEIRADYGIKLNPGSAPAGGASDPPKGTDQLTAAMVAKAGVRDLEEMSPEDLKRLSHSLGE